MARWTSKGKCNLCGESFTKTGMTKHLLTCRATHEPKLTGSGKVRQTQLFHLLVEGSELPFYWMHLEVPAEATLQALDQFLRDIWVECCGHLSAFTIEGTQYEMDTGGVDAMWPEFFGSPYPTRTMNVQLKEVLEPGLQFGYEYDFGTTTYLNLKVIAVREGKAKGKSVQILARNDPPPWTCEKCGQPATQVCSSCIYEGKGWLCDRCAPKHRCGEDMLLPVVNSPRVGMCGYTG